MMKLPATPLILTAALVLAGCASSASPALDEGIRFYRDGYFASARDAFDAAVRYAPSSAIAWNDRAVARVRLGDLTGAIEDYTRAIELAPADAEIYFNRGNAYAAAGNLPAAIGDFTQATALRPGYTAAFYNRGTIRASAGDYIGATRDWQWAVDLERDPWTKAAMRQGAGLDYVAALPAAAASPESGGVVTSPSPAAAVPPPPPTPSALTPEALDVRALVARGMGRETEGDRVGAITDLRAAVMAEPDPARRARIDRLLRLLEASR